MTAFTTHLSLGQKAFAVRGSLDFWVETITVGQIRVTETAPSLRAEVDRDPLFLEQYMCIETGVGSGTLWEYGKNIFSTEADAQAAVKVHQQRAYKQRAERDAFQAQERARKEERERAEFARLAQKFGAAQ
jgi:hypothetical protein